MPNYYMALIHLYRHTIRHHTESKSIQTCNVIFLFYCVENTHIVRVSYICNKSEISVSSSQFYHFILFLFGLCMLVCSFFFHVRKFYAITLKTLRCLCVLPGLLTTFELSGSQCVGSRRRVVQFQCRPSASI